MIIFLVKVFRDAAHADAFMSGMMYANRLSHFKNIDDDCGRSDADEGAVFLRRDGAVLTLRRSDPLTGDVDEIEITERDLAGPVVMHLRRFDHINLFCMYAGHTGTFDRITDQNISEFKRHLEIPSDCIRMGAHAVVITNVSEFFRRVKSGARRSGYRLFGRLVEYYDADLGTLPPTKDMDTLFRKRKEFAHQKEYRIAIETSISGSGPITLDIGRIDDIAMRMDTEDINRSMKIERNLDL